MGTAVTATMAVGAAGAMAFASGFLGLV